MLNEDQVRGIVDGVTEGFKVNGMDLNEKEKMVVKLTVKSTIQTIERALNNPVKG